MPLLRFIRCRNGTVAHVYDWGSQVRLPSGQTIIGKPQGTPEQAATARELGYGGDVLQMIRDHDPGHVLLADWLGLPVSQSMAMAAGLPHDPALAALDEAAVIALQKYMRHAGVRLP